MSMFEERGRLCRELSMEARRFYRLKYQMSNGGNLSARLPGREAMLVKATDVDFSRVAPDTLALTDLEGKLLEGEVRPSKEALLHGTLYAAFPEVGAIMHCHSPWATAWAAKHDSLLFSTHHSRLKLKGYCPVFDTESYVVPQTFFPQIIREIREHPGMNSFLLRGHGQMTLGKDIREAAALAELVEETAQIALLARL